MTIEKEQTSPPASPPVDEQTVDYLDIPICIHPAKGSDRYIDMKEIYPSVWVRVYRQVRKLFSRN